MEERVIIKPKEFKDKNVELQDIFLDPNNPRFSIESDSTVPDSKITENSVQETCLTKMKSYGINALKESIKRVGFVQIDKVVVRPLKMKKFVVVEGNRRIAALKILEKELNRGEVELPKEVNDTIFQFKVVVYRGKEKDMAWIIQGIRHISGIRNWPSYQQAEVLVKISQ